MIELRILNRNSNNLKVQLGDLADKVRVQAGDTVVTGETQEEVGVCRAVFERLIKTGQMVAFAVTNDGVGKEKIHDWDTDKDPRVVIFGPLVGG